MSLFAELKRRKLIRVAVVYAATAFVVLQAADIMLPQPGEDSPQEPPARDSATHSIATAPSGDAAPASTGVAREQGLIAVLPFRNRSVREEDAFFAEGIHYDLLTQLSKVAAFRVT